MRLRVARVRAWRVRHRVIGRAIVVSSLVVAAGLVGSVVAEARSTRAMWGSTVPIVVVARDIEPGAPISPDELTIAHRLEAFVVDDALTELPDDEERSVRRLRAGETLTRRDLQSTSEGIDLPEGHRAIGLPLDPTVPNLVVGDLVDLHVISDVFASAGPADQHASPAVVVDVTEEAVMLAVETERVAELATARSTGRVVIALR